MKKFFVFLILNLICIPLEKSFGIGDKSKECLLIFFLKEKRDITTEKSLNEDFMKNLMYKELYSTFNVGLPNQNIKFYYEINEIIPSISKEFYFPKRSTTFKLIEDKKYSQEILILDKTKKIDNFTFFLKEKLDSNKEKNYNSIGLGYSKDNYHLSFLSQLNKNGYIKKKIFSFLFGDDSLSESRIFDGQLLLGDYPHSISPYFKEKDLKFISLKEKEKWILEFDLVKIDNYELKEKISILDVNLNVIIGPENLRKKIISSFLNESLKNGICKENSFKSDKDGQTYIFYSFDNRIKFKKFPTLFFFNKILNETFKISFSDLITRHNEKYIFNIIFNEKPKNEWVLGQKFFNKYKFVFDLEEGKIGYYKSNENNYNTFIIIFSIVFFCLIFVIGLLRGLYLRQKSSKINNISQIPYIRKEYSQIPENKETNEINQNYKHMFNKKNENQKNFKDKQKKD